MSLTEELKNDLTRNVEKKGHLVQNCGLWIQRCEETRRAEDAAPQAENVCNNDIENFLASRNAGETRSKEAAEKVWQASQSSTKKGENLEDDLKYILQAMKNYGRRIGSEGKRCVESGSGRRDVQDEERRGSAIKFQHQALSFVLECLW